MNVFPGSMTENSTDRTHVSAALSAWEQVYKRLRFPVGLFLFTPSVELHQNLKTPTTCLLVRVEESKRVATLFADRTLSCPEYVLV